MNLHRRAKMENSCTCELKLGAHQVADIEVKNESHLGTGDVGLKFVGSNPRDGKQRFISQDCYFKWLFYCNNTYLDKKVIMFFYKLFII